MFKVIGFISSIIMLFWLLYSLFGGIPLLILKYDIPKDSRFVRGFYNLHYKILSLIALLASTSFFIAENKLLAASYLVIFIYALIAVKTIVARMDYHKEAVLAFDSNAIKKYKQLNGLGVLLSVICLISIFWIFSQSNIMTCKPYPPDGKVMCSLF